MAKQVAKSSDEALKNAEALGQIKPLPAAEEARVEAQTGEDLSEEIDTVEKFNLAVGNAQMEGLEYVEVSEKIFNYLLRNQKGSAYLTYGKPGIKIFKKGTREDIEAQDSLNAEVYGDVMAKKRAAEFQKKVNGVR